MYSEDYKIFRDPIYGYISIRKNYCRDFIDTAIFQRLRRIEQTSMRILYPSAHHDRFAHSIGVYHLGTLAFSYLYSNSSNCFQDEISSEKWELYRKTFEIACLMHDCGHSPFSHTFEHFYLYRRETEIKDQIATHFADKQSFVEDYDASSPASHEKISALLVLEKFTESILQNGASPELVARMIMGCKHSSPKSKCELFENKLIFLLNGSGIDVDSLDYIQRDSWVSGVSNVEIDYQRLLSSLLIMPDQDGKPQIVFKKSALSVLDNISLGRNFLYKWIYSHHIVTYEQYLLNEIIKLINHNTHDEFCQNIFSINSFFDNVSVGSDQFYLPSDDDLMHIFKKYHKGNETINEFLSRKYKYKALWKTYFEFDEHFKNISVLERLRIYTQIGDGKLFDKYGPMLCLKVEPKLKGINPCDFFICIEDKLVDASISTSQTNQNLSYYILYVEERLLHRKNEIITDVRKL